VGNKASFDCLLKSYFLTSTPAKTIKIDYVCQSYSIPKLWTFYFKTWCIFSTASDCCNMKTMHQFYSVYGDSP